MRTSCATVLMLALGLALSGCGSKSTPATQTKAAAPVRKVANPADALSPYLVAAVVTGKTGATLLQVKYELAGHPDVGDPVDVDLVIIPAADSIDRLSGSIQGEDGFDVVSGGTIAPTEKPAFGTPIHHAIKVVARRDGIYVLTANLSVEAGGESLGPVYTLPIIAGNGLIEAGATPSPAAAAPKPASTAAAQ